MKKKVEKETEIGLDITGSNQPNGDSAILQLEALEKQLQEANQKYTLLYADFENFRKRSQKEKDEVKSSTKAAMVSSILDMDNDIALAIKNIGDAAARQGVELIAGKIAAFLKGHGIEPIQTQEYDEDLHEVVSVLEVGEQRIIDVVSKGYSMNGKPFRFPKIILGK